MKLRALVSLALALPFASRAVDGSWSVDAGGNWSTAANWLGGIAATGANGTAYFTNAIAASRAVTNDIPVSVAIGRLSFAPGAANSWTVEGNPLALTLSAAGAATVTVSSGTAALRAAVTGGTNVLKLGNGVLVLSGTNSFVGGTTINAGWVSVQEDANLGATNGNVTLNGGHLAVTASFTNRAPRALAVNAAGILDVAPGVTYTLVNGQLTGAQTLTKSNTGTLVISQTSGNSGYTGTLTVNAGTVLLAGSSGDGALRGNATINNGGTLRFGYNNPAINSAVITVNAGGIFDLGGFNDVIAFIAGAGSVTNNHATLTLDLGAATNTFSGSISGVGGLTLRGINGPGMQILSGTNTYTGALTLQAGTLGVSAYDHIGPAGKVVNFNGGALRVTGTAVANLDAYAVVWSNFSGALDIATAGHTFSVTNQLGGPGPFTKLGTGTVALAAGSTSTGTVVVTGGRLNLLEGATLATKYLQVLFGATFAPRYDTSLPGVPALYVSQSGGFGRIDLSFVTNLPVASFTIDGLTQAAGTWGATGSGATYTNDSVFSGTGVLNVLGGFTAVDTSGSWGVNAGGNWADTNNWIDGQVAYGTNATAYFTNALTADRTANNGFTTLPLGHLVFGSPTNNWTITNNTIRLDVLSGAPTITVATNTATISSVLAGAQGMVKAGPGMLIVNAGSSYTGDTVVAAGTLHYAGNGSPYLAGTLPGQLTVQSNAVLSLARSDTFGAHNAYPSSVVSLEAGSLAQNTGVFFTTFRNLAMSGGELRANGGNGTTWPAYQLKGTVTVSGASASRITAYAIANGQHQVALGNNITNGTTTFDVADVTSNDAADLVVAAGFADGRAPATPYPFVSSGFIKRGPGTMRLAGSSVNRGTNTLETGVIELAGSATLNGPLALAGGTTLYCENGPGLLGEYYYLGGTAPVAANFASPQAMNAHLSTQSLGLLYNMSMTITNFDFAANGAYLPVNYGPSLANFVIRWAGTFVAPVDGAYYFGMNSDDGSYLWIDGTNVITKNGAGGFGTNTVTLAAGLHEIVFALFQGTGAYGLYCDVAIAGGPTNRLSVTNLLSGPAVTALDGGAGATIILSNTTLTVGQTNDTSFAGTITSLGSGRLRKVGPGTLALTAANAIGGVTLAGGRLRITDDAQIGGATSAVTFAGGTLQMAGSLTNLDVHEVNWSSFNGGVDVAGASQVVTITNTLSGPGNLNKYGPGALLLTANNTLTGTTTAAGGYLVLAPPASNAIGPMVVSGGSTGAIAVIAGRTSLLANNVTVGAAAGDRSALVISNDLSSLRLLVGNNSTAAGAVIHNAGTANIGTSLTGQDVLSLGLGGGGYGYYQMNGGVLNAGQIAPGGNSTNVSGVFDLYDGIVNLTAGGGWIVLGWQKANAALNIFNGQITNTPSGNDVTLGFAVNGGSFGMINLIGTNALLNTLGGGTTRTLNMMNNTGNLMSVVNVNGGRLIANRVRQNANGLTVFGFNGGTLQANGGSTQAQFMQGLSSAFLYPNGAIIDSSNSTITVAQPLLAPAGNGVASIPVVSGGTGYVGAPVVSITGGGGTGATAIAQVNLTVGDPFFGQVTNILITSAGASYASAPAVSLVGGGALLPATLGAATLGVNVSGGFMKRGSGTLTLAATNTYGGLTTVDDGTLILGNPSALSTGAVLMASTSTALGVAYAIDQAALNALGARIVPGSSPAAFVLGASNTNNLDLGAAGLTNWAVGVSAGTFTNSGVITAPSTNLYLGAGNGTLVHTAPLVTGTNVFIGAYGIKPTVVIGSTNAGYASGIEAVNGTLRAGAASALGGAGATVRVNAGATLDAGGQNLGAVPVFVQGSGASNNGAIVNTVADQVNALQNVTLTGDTLIGGANRWDIRTGGIAASLNLAGFTLTKTNANYVALVNSIVSDGSIVHAQGTLSLEANTTITGGVGTITVQPGATLQFWSQSGPVMRPITLNGGTLHAGSGVNAIGAPISLAGLTNTVSAAYAATFAPTGAISGSGALLKTGSGLVKLVPAALYSGRTLVSSGLLELASADVNAGTLPGTSDVLIYGAGTVQLDYPAALAGTNQPPVTLATGGVLTVSSGVVGRVAGSFALAGGNLAGGTPDALNGNWLIDTSVPASGPSFITAPRVQLNGTIAFNVANGGVLTASGAMEDPGLGTAGTGTLVKTGAGTLVLSATNSYGGATEVAQGTLKIAQGLPVSGAAFWLDAADAQTVITDSSNLVVQWVDKSGYGRSWAQATQANRPAYTNNALVNGLPVLRFTGGTQVLPADFSFFAGTSYSIFAVEGRRAAGNLYFLGMNGTGTNNNQLHFGYRTDTSFTLAQYGNDLNATVAGYTGQTFRVWDGICDTNNGHFLWMSGTNTASSTNKIPFGASLTQGGVGRGNNLTFNGDLAEIIIYPRVLSSDERLAVEAYLNTKWMGAQLPAVTNLLPPATPLRIAAGATFDLAGVGQNVGSLSDLAGGGGTVTNGSAAPATLVVGNDNGNASFSGTLVDGAGLLALTKTGAGTQTLHGANTSDGPTWIEAGSLVVNGTMGTGDVVVLSGATLGGTGSLAGVVQNMGTVAPGSSPGTLTVGLLVQLPGSSLALEIASTNVGGYDRLVAGAAVLDGTLAVAATGYVAAAGDSFTIVSSAYTGGFAATNLPALAGGLGWDVQYQAGAIVLAVTGAPSATGYDLAATVITNGLTGYQDDADGDGFANLLEYVTGGSLTNAGIEARMQGARTNGLLALRFGRNTNATDTTLIVEGSGSAANGATWLGIATNSGGSWGAATNVITIGTGSPVTETVYDNDAGTNRFLRLRVTRP